MILSFVANILDKANDPSSLYYCHPEYMARWWWREFNRVSYVGGREYSKPSRLTVEFDFPVITRNSDGSLAMRSSDGLPVDPSVQRTTYPSMLYRHNREKTWEYENRRRRAHYYNIVATTINSLVSKALKKGVERIGTDEMKEFWKAVDCQRKTDIDTFMRDGLRMAQVEGMMWACVDVDTPEAGEKPEPGSAQPDGKPYAYWINPLDILDWSIDDDGNLLWLKQFIYFEAERTPTDAIRPMHRFRIWYPDRVEEIDVDAGNGTRSATTTTKTTIGRIPFEPLYAKKNHEAAFPDGDPLASDLAKSANAIYNYTSLLDEILYKQTFSWLTVPDKNVDAVQIGTNTVFGYNALTGGGKPEYVSPNPEQARVLMESIIGELARARQAFGIGQPNEGTKQKSSAAAMELENEDKRSILGDISASAQDFENRLCALVEDYSTGGRSSKTDSKNRVEYPADFDLQALQDEIAEALSLRAVGMSPEIMLAIRKSLASRKLGALPEDEREKLLDTLTVKNDVPAPVPASGDPVKAADSPWPSADPNAAPGGGAPPGKPGAPPAAPVDKPADGRQRVTPPVNANG